jgi:hypothetical protein
MGFPLVGEWGYEGELDVSLSASLKDGTEMPGPFFPADMRPLNVAPPSINFESEIRAVWMLSLPPGTDFTGLTDLESQIASDLGISGDPFAGSLLYESLVDCTRVADEMMLRRSDLIVLAYGGEPPELVARDPEKGWQALR